jgi:hypothetical protein
MQARQEVGVQQLALGEKPQPPIPALFLLLRLIAPYQVAFAEPVR